MARPKNIIVICEGASEWVYLQRLNSFLAAHPFPDGWWEPPIRFIGKPKRGVGNGTYKAIVRALNNERQQNKTTEIWVWVDADLYVRNEHACGDSYRNRPAAVPAFRFSAFNFEDFLALHLDDDRFAHWLREMTTCGHLQRPLPWSQYESHLLTILPNYRKGELPADFITPVSLGNLKRHLGQMPKVCLQNQQNEPTFARALLQELTRWYPDL